MDRRLQQTWWTLKIALGGAALVAGLDKFFNLLTNWTDYLNPMAVELVPVDPQQVMWAVGVIEMIVGVAILTRWTKWAAYVAALWFVAIAVNLVSMGRFYDVAVRDLLLAVSAFSLARLSALRQEELASAVEPAWEPSPRGILSLNL